MFADLSQPQKYVSLILNLKRREENETSHVNNRKKETYNILFSIDELASAIQATHDSAPGPDHIHNVMFKHLPPEGMDTLLNLYNKKVQQVYFPEEWLTSTISPISKPGKTQ